MFSWYKGGTSASLSTRLKYFRDDPGEDHLLELSPAQRQLPFVLPLPETDFLFFFFNKISYILFTLTLKGNFQLVYLTNLRFKKKGMSYKKKNAGGKKIKAASGKSSQWHTNIVHCSLLCSPFLSMDDQMQTACIKWHKEGCWDILSFILISCFHTRMHMHFSLKNFT